MLVTMRLEDDFFSFWEGEALGGYVSFRDVGFLFVLPGLEGLFFLGMFFRTTK